MLDRLLSTGPAAPDAVVTPAGATPWAALRARVPDLADRLAGLAGRRVGLLFQAGPLGVAALAALDRLACDVFLLDARLDAPAASALAGELGLAALLGEGGPDLSVLPLAGPAPGSGSSTVTILTSGTTGKPKAARHTWEGLCRPVRRAGPGAPGRWLLSYRPHLYAGLQVLLQCLANGGALVVPGPDDPPAAVADLMARAAVEGASATPSWWRRLLLFGGTGLRRAPLRQVTLGGEVVDQQVLDALREAFPTARVVHVYATTELGRCFSVTDGRAGFPARFLEGPSPDGVELKVGQGELLARSPNRMLGYDGAGPGLPADGWVRTGDLVEVRADRVHFVGRRSDLINVGGNKVAPLAVERVVRAVPGVLDVRVFARRSSLAGELVACEVVPAPGADPASLRRLIIDCCVAELSAPQRPRLLELVHELPLSAVGKTARGPS
jgi:acyl-CoA synthetase (AMP-forming)/AMP-acid ligase II